MSPENRKAETTLEDALARRVETQRGPESPAAEGLRELGRVDRAVYAAVAEAPTPHLDAVIRRLSDSANYSRLWLGIAAAIAVLGRERGRRAAIDGVASIGVTSAAVNLGAKSVFTRARPRRRGPAAFPAREVKMPTSTSFPSGHSASAFAFAHAVGRHFPTLAVPLRLLAGAVAYSRVHTGVHYPGDAVVGSIMGEGTAAMVTAASDRLRDARVALAYGEQPYSRGKRRGLYPTE
jgi:membrane-associated phospholipid phosphatase